MGWIARFFLLVVFLSITELYLLIWVADRTSILTTLALCILTGVVGGALVRRQGLQTLAKIRQSTAAGKVPAQDIVSGLILLIIGTLFLTPGFLTDTAAFLLLMPPFRKFVAAGLISYFQHRIQFRDIRTHRKTRQTEHDDVVIEAEAEFVDPRGDREL